ncbi:MULTISPECIES: hypothetical protein [unclassified Rhizobium]|uniref:hypothetical protein n=1 Tax=unclassified Rhizobium TaxID=2613769 RepID=UPI0016766804|nr:MULTISPECIES: hypothetical protein [unclassified Rhizobium]
MRIGELIVPNAHHTAVENVLASTALMISPFTCAVLEQWLLDGMAETINKAVQQEALRGYALACPALGSAILLSDYSGYHVWLPMQRGDAVRFETEALANGIIVTPPLSTLTPPRPRKAE